MSTEAITNTFFPLTLPLAYGSVNVAGVLRQHPNYFFVEERLGFDPDGEGEHVYLFIEKTAMNTQHIADRLATLAGIAKSQVSYSGMKDRHAVTRQWFSVHLPGNKSEDWTALNSDNVTVLKIRRHRKKLRRGVHKGNVFRIKLTELTGNIAELEHRLKIISQRGVPNYFGEQRFGRDGANVQNAQKWFAGKFTPKRHQRSIYLSAARSLIFNQVLGKRVSEHCWDTVSAGECLMLDGSRSVFTVGDEDLSERLHCGDIHPTGPLYGQTDCEIGNGKIARLEKNVFDQYPDLVQGLVKAGLKLERRALRMIPTDLSWQIEGDSIELSFFLHRGCFATVLIRELINYQQKTQAGVVCE